jgi:hypothetical protein
MRTAIMMAVMLALLNALTLPAAAQVQVPLSGLKVVPLAGVEATVAPRGSALAVVSFQKSGDERRLLALEGSLPHLPVAPKALEVAYTLTLKQGPAPRLAIIIFEKGGCSWYKLAGVPLQTGGAATTRLSVAALTPTAFSTAAGAPLDWAAVEKVWLGLVFDSPAAGRLEVTSARLTDQPFVPTQPLRLTGTGPGQWGLSKDPAVEATLTTPSEGPQGQPCLKVEFTAPVGRHMYVVPSTPVLAEDLEGYTNLRFQHLGVLPQGMKLLVMLAERTGALYYVERSGPWSDQWREVKIPLTEFKLASWGSPDDNGKLDLGLITTLTLGSHGGAQEDLKGLIMAADIELVP